MADLFCDSVQSDFLEQICGTETGRIIGLGLVLPSAVGGSPEYDPSEDQDWLDGESASPRSHWIINAGVRGEMSRAADTEDEGFGLDATNLTGAEHSATLQVKGIEGNVEFTNQVNLKKWFVALVTSAKDSNGDYLMYWIDVPCTVVFRPTVQTDLKSVQIWDVSIKWSSIYNPDFVPVPESLEPEA